MFYLVKTIFYFLLLFFSFNSKVIANEKWIEINPDPAIIWQVNDVITGFMEQPVGNNFLITNSDFFPVTDNFIWQFEFNLDQGVDHNFIWGFIDQDNYYQLHFSTNAIWLNRFINGQEMLAKGINFSWQPQQTYQLKLVRENGFLTIFLDSYEIFNFYDWTYDPQTSLGSWGFKLSAGTVYPIKTIIKNIKFLDHNLFILPIKQFLQTDVLWSNQIYDHAEIWSSEPTISRWGCALTSAAMILNFHGFEYLPSGEVLNPGSLNNWLKNQPDGYIGNGLVNWWAITRLTNQLSDIDSLLPKLEFSVIKENWQIAAELLIRSRVPTIAQVPGHFIVLNGFDQDSHDFLLIDPLVGEKKLTDYEQVNSLRVFQPSYTDLSYLVITHLPTTEVKIFDETNDELETITFFEQLTNDQAVIFLTVLAKPTEQQYFLEINNLIDDYLPTIYAYDQMGKASSFTIEKNNLKNQKIKLDFKKNSRTTFKYFFNWDDFLNLVNYFFDQQLISQNMKDRLKERVELIRQSTDSQSQLRHEKYLKNLLNFYAKFIDQDLINKLEKIFIELTSLVE